MAQKKIITLKDVYKQKKKQGIYESSLDRSLATYNKRIIKHRTLVDILYDAFEDFVNFVYDVHTNLCVLFDSICSVIAYIPVTYKQRDWDFAFLLSLVEFKLKRMKKCFDEDECLSPKELQKICRQIDSTLKSIHNYNNYDEVFEEKNQELLQRLMSADTEDKLNELLKEYYCKLYEFETNSYKEVWNKIAQYSLGWWS